MILANKFQYPFLNHRNPLKYSIYEIEIIHSKEARFEVFGGLDQLGK